METKGKKNEQISQNSPPDSPSPNDLVKKKLIRLITLGPSLKDSRSNSSMSSSDENTAKKRKDVSQREQNTCDNDLFTQIKSQKYIKHIYI